MKEEKFLDLSSRVTPFTGDSVPSEFLKVKEKGNYKFIGIKSISQKEQDDPRIYSAFAKLLSPSGKEELVSLEKVVKYFESSRQTSKSSK